MEVRSTKHIIEARNSKHEIRNSKIERSTESSLLSVKYLNIKFSSLFDFSDFGFRILTTEGSN